MNSNLADNFKDGLKAAAQVLAQPFKLGIAHVWLLVGCLLGGGVEQGLPRGIEGLQSPAFEQLAEPQGRFVKIRTDAGADLGPTTAAIFGGFNQFFNGGNEFKLFGLDAGTPLATDGEEVGKQNGNQTSHQSGPDHPEKIGYWFKFYHLILVPMFAGALGGSFAAIVVHLIKIRPLHQTDREDAA